MFPFQCLLRLEFHSFNLVIQQQLTQAGAQRSCQGTAISSTLFPAKADMDAPPGSPRLDKITLLSAISVHSFNSCTCFIKICFLPKEENLSLYVLASHFD